MRALLPLRALVVAMQLSWVGSSRAAVSALDMRTFSSVIKGGLVAPGEEGWA